MPLLLMLLLRLLMLLLRLLLLLVETGVAISHAFSTVVIRVVCNAGCAAVPYGRATASQTPLNCVHHRSCDKTSSHGIMTCDWGSAAGCVPV